MAEDATRDDIEPLKEDEIGKWAANIIPESRSRERIRSLEIGMGIRYTMEAKGDVRGAIEEAVDRGEPEGAPHEQERS